MKAFLVSLDAVTGDLRECREAADLSLWCQMTREVFECRLPAPTAEEAASLANRLRLEVWGWQARVTEGGAL